MALLTESDGPVPAPYVCPGTHAPLEYRSDGLYTPDGARYPLLQSPDGLRVIPDFRTDVAADSPAPADPYAGAKAAEIYENFMSWLFATFGVSEDYLRAQLVKRLALQSGQRVLVTGCGLGGDLLAVRNAVGPTGSVFGQDLSAVMIMEASRRVASTFTAGEPNGVHLSVGDAAALPFPDRFFDSALHFGGINGFEDPGRAIAEMNRVVRVNGTVVFGDEGVAPWLRRLEYGQMAITNNRLWSAEAPLALLPSFSQTVTLTWLLGNCFYLVSFCVGDSLPYMNPDIPHKGVRGGSMRSRFYGQIEGIHPDLKARLLAAAAADGTSVVAWLEAAIEKELL